MRQVAAENGQASVYYTAMPSSDGGTRLYVLTCPLRTYLEHVLAGTDEEFVEGLYLQQRKTAARFVWYPPGHPRHDPRAPLAVESAT